MRTRDGTLISTAALYRIAIVLTKDSVHLTTSMLYHITIAIIGTGVAKGGAHLVQRALTRVAGRDGLGEAVRDENPLHQTCLLEDRDEKRPRDRRGLFFVVDRVV